MHSTSYWRRIAVLLVAHLVQYILQTPLAFSQSLNSHPPAYESRIKQLNTALLVSATDVDKTGMQMDVSHPGARYLRLEISQIHDNSTADYEIVVYRRDLTRVATYSKADFSRQQRIWTPEIQGSFARVAVLPKEGKMPVGLQVMIPKYIHQVAGAVLESIRDPLNPKLKPVVNYSNDATLQRVARTVAKLRYVGDDGTAVCSGFLVGPDLLLTNQHCVPTNEICSLMKIFLDWDPNAEGGASEFLCTKIERVDAQLDFTLIRLNGRPGESIRWGHLKIDPRDPGTDESLYVVQYPGIREPKSVARDDCHSTIIPAPGVVPSQYSDFGHSCDSKTGSSGSPVLSAANQVIGLHHWGFDLRDRDWQDQNRAVRMKSIATAINGFLQ